MADAPELVTELTQPSSSTSPTPKSPSNEPISEKEHASTEKQQFPAGKEHWVSPETVNGPSPASPLNDSKKEDPLDRRAGSGLEAIAQTEEEEKQAIEPDNEETSPKIAVGKPDSEGLEAVHGQTEGQGNRAVYLNGGGDDEDEFPSRKKDETEWHNNFWEFWKPGSLFIESIFCPCVLTGRTHQHLHDPTNPHPASTNLYCTSCCALNIFLLAGAPVFCFMTTAQRREVRYRYHIKGNNGEDCIKATICCCCSLVQEEKEVVWRMGEERRKVEERKKGQREMEKRNEVMEYKPVSPR